MEALSCVSFLKPVAVKDLKSMNSVILDTDKNKAITTSLIIAQRLNKQHKNILAAVRNKSKHFIDGLNFQLVTYIDEKNESRPMYLLDRDFALYLILGFQGEKIESYKIEFVKQFNQMESYINALQSKNLSVTEQMQLQLFSSDPLKVVQANQYLCNEAVQRTIKQLEPDVTFSKTIQNCDDSISIGAFAKLISEKMKKQIGQNRLYEWLRSNGYLHSCGSDKNLPTQRSIDCGWFSIHECMKNGHICLTSRITGKGQKYFIQRLLKKEDDFYEIETYDK